MAVQGNPLTPTKIFLWNQITEDGKLIKHGLFFSTLGNASNYATGGGDYVDFSRWFRQLFWADCQIAQNTPIAQFVQGTTGTLNGYNLATQLQLGYGQDITTGNLPGFYSAVAANNQAVVYVMATAHSHGNANTYATATLTQGEVGAANQVSATAFGLQLVYGRFYVIGV